LSPTELDALLAKDRLEDVEFATLEWVAWYNGSRLLEPLGYVPPAEFEKAYHDRQAAPVGLAVLT